MRFSERIDAPIDVVFDFLADQRNAAPLLAKGITVRQQPPGTIAVGTVFIVQRGTLTSTIEITGWDRPTSWSARSGSLTVDQTFRADGDETIATIAVPWPYVGVTGWVAVLLAPFTPWFLALMARRAHQTFDLARSALEPGGDGTPAFHTPDPWALRRALLIAVYVVALLILGFVVGLLLAR